MNSNSPTWWSYEELARHVLMHFAGKLGISEVEANQKIKGESGTAWEIDAKGVNADGCGFLVVQCKERSAARLNQAEIGSLAFTVEDLGAQGAIIVTSIGLQEGAKKVAQHEDFKVVFLPKEATHEEFFASYGNLLIRKIPADHMGVGIGLASLTYSKAETK